MFRRTTTPRNHNNNDDAGSDTAVDVPFNNDECRALLGLAVGSKKRGRSASVGASSSSSSMPSSSFKKRPRSDEKYYVLQYRDSIARRAAMIVLVDHRRDTTGDGRATDGVATDFGMHDDSVVIVRQVEEHADESISVSAVVVLRQCDEHSLQPQQQEQEQYDEQRAEHEVTCTLVPTSDGHWFDVFDNQHGRCWPRSIMRVPNNAMMRILQPICEAAALFEPKPVFADTDQFAATQVALANATLKSAAPTATSSLDLCSRSGHSGQRDADDLNAVLFDTFDPALLCQIARPRHYDMQGLFSALFAMCLYLGHFFAYIQSDGKLLFRPNRRARIESLSAQDASAKFGRHSVHTLRWRDVSAALLQAGQPYTAERIGSLRQSIGLDVFLLQHALALPSYAKVIKQPCCAPPALIRLHSDSDSDVGRMNTANDVDRFGQALLHGARPDAIVRPTLQVSYDAVAHLFSHRSPLWLAPALPVLGLDYWVLHAQREAQWEFCKSFEAHVLQRPDEKPKQALFYCGPNRIGKDFAAKSLLSIVGENLGAATSRVEALTDRFNSYASEKVFLVLDEQALSGLTASQTNHIKHVLTESKVRIERKGLESTDEPNVFRVRFHGNDLFDAVYLRNFTGRITVVDVCGAVVQCLDKVTKAALFNKLSETRAGRNNLGLRTMALFLYRFSLANYEPGADALVTDTMRALAERQLPPVLQWFKTCIRQCRIVGCAEVDEQPLSCSANGRRWAMHAHAGHIEHRRASVVGDCTDLADDCDDNDCTLMMSGKVLHAAFGNWYTATRGDAASTARDKQARSCKAVTNHQSFASQLSSAFAKCDLELYNDGFRFLSSKKRAWHLPSPRQLAKVMSAEIPGLSIGEAVQSAHIASLKALESATRSGDATLVRCAMLLLGRNDSERPVAAAVDDMLSEFDRQQCSDGNERDNNAATTCARADLAKALDAGRLGWQQLNDVLDYSHQVGIPRSTLRRMGAYEFCEQEAARMVQARDTMLSDEEKLQRVLRDFALEHDPIDQSSYTNVLDALRIGDADVGGWPSRSAPPSAPLSASSVLLFPTAEQTKSCNRYTFEHVIGHVDRLCAHVATTGRALAILHYPGPDIFWIVPPDCTEEAKRDQLTRTVLIEASTRPNTGAGGADGPDIVSLLRPLLTLHDLYTAPQRCRCFFDAQRCDWLLLREDNRYSRLRRTRSSPQPTDQYR